MLGQHNKKLIVHSGGIGDLLLALPAMRSFRARFPDSSLELLGFPERLSLVTCDLGATAVHSIDRAEMAHLYLANGILHAEVASFLSSFDTALIFGKTGSRVLATNFAATGISPVVFIPSFPPDGMEVHTSTYLLECLGRYGITGGNAFIPLRLPDEMSAWGRDFLAKMGIGEREKPLFIHAGSGCPAKNWNPENFARVADFFTDQGPIFIIAGPAADGAQEVMAAVRKSSPRLLANLPLLRLAAIMQRGWAYVGNDSGISHLVGFLGIPTAVIFGPTAPNIWRPLGPLVQVITGGRKCTPCAEKTRSECFRECLEDIGPERVINFLSSFIYGKDIRRV